MTIRDKLLAHRQSHPNAFFTIELDDPAATTSALLRREEFRLWQSLLPDPEEDHEVALANIRRLTGKSERFIELSIGAYFRLKDMPFIHTLQEEHYWLDQPRLFAINEVVSSLQDTSVIPELDEALAYYLMPTQINQHFPTAGQIKRKIRDLARTLGTETRTKQSNPEEPVAKMEVRHDNDGRSYLDIDTSSDVGIEIEYLVRKHAKKKSLTPGEALLDLVREHSNTKIVINLYRAMDIPDSPGWVFGAGWLRPDVTDKLVDRADLIRNIDEVATQSSQDYVTPEIIRAFVAGRDGTCRYPGHTRRGDQTQMDHTMDFENGGPTHPDNLSCLCQHHHNIKTDGRVCPIQIGYGVIVWLHEDGTWVTTEPEGPLSPKARHWVQTVAQKNSKRGL